MINYKINIATPYEVLVSISIVSANLAHNSVKV